MDLISHVDALDGALVDANLQSVRLNPGLLAGNPHAREVGCQHDIAHDEGDEPLDDISSCCDSLDEPEPDSCFNATLGLQRQYAETWQDFSALVSQVPVGVAKPTFQFVSDFISVSSRLSPGQPGRPQRAPVHAEDLQVQYDLLHQDLLRWKQSLLEAVSVPTPFEHPSPCAHFPASSSFPATRTAAAWISHGECQDPRGHLNLKQCAFLLAFALDLDVSRLLFEAFFHVNRSLSFHISISYAPRFGFDITLFNCQLRRLDMN